MVYQQILNYITGTTDQKYYHLKSVLLIGKQTNLPSVIISYKRLSIKFKKLILNNNLFGRV